MKKTFLFITLLSVFLYFFSKDIYSFFISGKAVISANSTKHNLGLHHNTTYQLIDSWCEDVCTDITFEPYLKGDTVYIKNGKIVGSY